MNSKGSNIRKIFHILVNTILKREISRNNNLEKKHRQGYQSKPVQREEVGAWEKEQIW